jgi:hypothetical protein
VQVFLSYAPEDQDFAISLSRELTEHGLRVWRPSAEILPGENPWLRVGKALESSQALVVLLSPQSLRSELLQSELDYALGNSKFKERIFPILVRPTKNVPWILQKFELYDAKQSANKIGAAIAQKLKRVA